MDFGFDLFVDRGQWLAEPSKADRQVTTRIQQALDLVDIRLLDHLVVGGMDIVSFAERGWL